VIAVYLRSGRGGGEGTQDLDGQALAREIVQLSELREQSLLHVRQGTSALGESFGARLVIGLGQKGRGFAPQSLRDLTESIQRNGDRPLFIALDHLLGDVQAFGEGGLGQARVDASLSDVATDIQAVGGDLLHGRRRYPPAGVSSTYCEYARLNTDNLRVTRRPYLSTRNRGCRGPGIQPMNPRKTNERPHSNRPFQFENRATMQTRR